MDYSEFRKKFGISEKQAEAKPPVDSGMDRKDDVNEELDIKDKSPDETTNLSALSKAELLKFAGKKKLYNKSFKELEQDALVQKILETVKAKVVEAGLKTAEEAAALPEGDLIALFDTIGK